MRAINQPGTTLAGIALALGLAGAAQAATVRAECGDRAQTEAVRAAVRFVPDGGALSVRLIDPQLTGDPDAVRGLDAFIVRERDGAIRQVVYLNCRSALVESAANGSGFFVALLSAVIHHEAAHLRGLDESQAAMLERAFLDDLIRRGLLPAKEGLAYRRLLDKPRGEP